MDELVFGQEFITSQLDHEMSSSNTEGESHPPVVNAEDILDVSESFDLDSFEVVRREFFAHIREPSITFNAGKFSVNTACLNKFPETDFIQVMVNQHTKVLAIRPCKEDAQDSYAWCKISKGKRAPRQVTCNMFHAKIESLMNWNSDYRYKILGRVVRANGEYLLAFDLNSSEAFLKVSGSTSRTPVYPQGWQNQFGVPFSEHKQEQQINIFDGYYIIPVKEKTFTRRNSKSANEDVSLHEKTGGVESE